MSDPRATDELDNFYKKWEPDDFAKFLEIVKSEI